MTANYEQCYRALRVGSDCTLQEMRLAYRRRVRLCHPDLKPPGETGNRDEEFKRIVKAYRSLASFHRRHGKMPPPNLRMDGDHSETIHAAAGESVTGMRSDRTKKSVRASWRLPGVHLAVFAAFVSGVCTAAIFERLDDNRHERQQAVASGGQLAVGMDPKTVVDLQGVPNHTTGSIWFYGDSGIIFDRGCVIGWENQPPFPLQTRISTTWIAERLIEKPATPSGERLDCVVPGT